MAAAAATSFAVTQTAEGTIHYSGYVFIKLTGNAQASLPRSNGASLAFKNSSGSLFYQKFHFSMKRVISGCAHGYFLSASGRNWLSNLRSGQNLSAGTFGSVAGNPYYGVLFAGTDGRFAPR